MDAIWDCAIIGGGPAGLSAALVLGRARRNVVLFDAGRPRNAVTRETHGYLTRDGISPQAFRQISHEELARYPTVQLRRIAVADVRHSAGYFQLRTTDGRVYLSRKILLATGLVEQLPAVPGIRDHYGVSLFSCPYCDGWERRDEPLVILSETEHAFDMVKSVYPWSRHLFLATNGHAVINSEQRWKLARRGIPVYEQRIRALVGTGGRLEKMIFENGEEARATGGFVTPVWSHPNAFDLALGCRRNDHGGIAADDFGRTGVHGVFAAGDAANIVPPQLIVAAAGGCRAGIGINAELTAEEF